MITDNKIIKLLTIISIIVTITLCNAKQNTPHYYPNYLSISDPISIHITIFNTTHQIVTSSLSMLYSLQQPLQTISLEIPVFRDMDNLTIEVSMWSQEAPNYPIATSRRNLTRYMKIRNGGSGFGMQLEGLPQKVQQDAKYGLHVPVRFSMLVIYSEYLVPYSKDMFSILGMRLVPKHNANQKYYILPVDVSQMQVPFKTYKPISSLPNSTHQIQFILKPFSLTYYQLLLGMTNRQFLQQANPLMAQIYTQQTIDLIKQTLFDNNFYLVVLYFTLSFIQVFMQIFAFKNQIQVWKHIENKPGLSIQVLYQRLLFQVIICLYLYQKQANKLYQIFQLFDLVLTCWKITRAVKVSFSRNNRFFISMHYKQWYHNKVQSADSQATHYTNYLIILFFVPFMLYKLYPVATKSYDVYIKTQTIPLPTIYQIYMFILQSSVMFILVFGFVMMTPQLYINYKLKSVDHLPWKTLIYRFIYTIIDDIFVFMIDLPWLQRMFSFRDDVIFVCYLVQRRIYRVDKNRLATATGSIDLTQVKKKEKDNSIEEGQQKHIKAQ